jgi:hypothetical protein
MYAETRGCGDDPQVSQRAVYWAAVDQFTRAKTLDPSRTAEMNNLINLYSQHFPTGDDLFFRGIPEGSTFRVGCWIQENTTVRSRPR